MHDETSKSIWSILQDFGFAPNADVISELKPGLSFDFGNCELHASAVIGESFLPVVLFTGVLATPRSLTEVCFEIPREPLSPELIAAWIVWHLDRATRGQFQPVRNAAWLDMGRRNQRQLPWEIARMESARESAAYATRPRCAVDRPALRLALNTLANKLKNSDAGASVIVHFDGRVLSFLCDGDETVVGATGKTWPSQYRTPTQALLARIPKRLRTRQVEVCIWKSALQVDGRYCGNVTEIGASSNGGVSPRFDDFAH